MIHRGPVGRPDEQTLFSLLFFISCIPHPRLVLLFLSSTRRINSPRSWLWASLSPFSKPSEPSSREQPAATADWDARVAPFTGRSRLHHAGWLPRAAGWPWLQQAAAPAPSNFTCMHAKLWDKEWDTARANDCIDQGRGGREREREKYKKKSEHDERPGWNNDCSQFPANRDFISAATYDLFLYLRKKGRWRRRTNSSPALAYTIFIIITIMMIIMLAEKEVQPANVGIWRVDSQFARASRGVIWRRRAECVRRLKAEYLWGQCTHSSTARLPAWFVGRMAEAEAGWLAMRCNIIFYRFIYSNLTHSLPPTQPPPTSFLRSPRIPPRQQPFLLFYAHLSSKARSRVAVRTTNSRGRRIGKT